MNTEATSSPDPKSPIESRPARGGDAPTWLRDLWYLALTSTELAPGAMVGRLLLGEPVLIGRTKEGEIFALRDICPHRGIPLSCGRFDGQHVECAYHGWKFGVDGRCAEIPSLVAEQAFAAERIKVRDYRVAERQGLIWIFFGADESEPPPVPMIEDLEGAETPAYVERIDFPCPLDDAVVGLMDPAHGPYVHRSWWWRTKASMHEKAKHYVPSHLGFTMARHPPSRNSFAYKILGGKPDTEISFQLPSVRIEHVKVGRHRFASLTAITPIDKTRCDVVQVMYWTMPWLSLLKPVLRPFIRAFLKQDRDTVERQQLGLAFLPPLILIDDADTPAKWYFRCKREFIRAGVEGRPFVNPVKERILRWKS